MQSTSNQQTVQACLSVSSPTVSLYLIAWFLPSCFAPAHPTTMAPNFNHNKDLLERRSVSDLIHGSTETLPIDAPSPVPLQEEPRNWSNAVHEMIP